ncbi:hypothetical protein M885DRAFT_210569 [Pelagophyceae sp. CCMP2097]|nr:hypothetical protein M885DRAFT_210569 [Pelagophyceae sp. CCMP2097]
MGPRGGPSGRPLDDACPRSLWRVAKPGDGPGPPLRTAPLDTPLDRPARREMEESLQALNRASSSTGARSSMRKRRAIVGIFALQRRGSRTSKGASSRRRRQATVKRDRREGPPPGPSTDRRRIFFLEQTVDGYSLDRRRPLRTTASHRLRERLWGRLRARLLGPSLKRSLGRSLVPSSETVSGPASGTVFHVVVSAPVSGPASGTFAMSSPVVFLRRWDSQTRRGPFRRGRDVGVAPLDIRLRDRLRARLRDRLRDSRQTDDGQSPSPSPGPSTDRRGTVSWAVSGPFLGRRGVVSGTVCDRPRPQRDRLRDRLRGRLKSSLRDHGHTVSWTISCLVPRTADGVSGPVSETASGPVERLRCLDSLPCREPFDSSWGPPPIRCLSRRRGRGRERGAASVGPRRMTASGSASGPASGPVDGASPGPFLGPSLGPSEAASSQTVRRRSAGHSEARVRRRWAAYGPRRRRDRRLLDEARRGGSANLRDAEARDGVVRGVDGLASRAWSRHGPRCGPRKQTLPRFASCGSGLRVVVRADLRGP